jgi:hypothetical protein
MGRRRDEIADLGRDFDRIAGQLLTLSRLEAGMGGTPGEETDRVELTRVVAEDARFEAEAGPPDSARAWRSPEGPSKHTADIRALNRACGGLQVEIVLPAQTGFG